MARKSASLLRGNAKNKLATMKSHKHSRKVSPDNASKIDGSAFSMTKGKSV